MPISRLAECIAETQKDCADCPIPAPIVGHVGDGNFHVAFLLDPENQSEVAEVQRLADRLTERTLAMGGTISGEHGGGLGKRKFMAREHGDEAWALMGDIKKTFDPVGILNPGKMVPGN